MNYYLKKWFEIQINLIKQQSIINPDLLYNKLIYWCKDLKESKEAHIKALYSLYLENYEFWDVSNYNTGHLADTFETFLEYDYFQQTPKDIERAIVLTRDVLWNIIAFKSEKECPNCNQDKLRVLTDTSNTVIYLSCDDCSYTEDIEGKEISIHAKLQPAIKKLVNLYLNYQR